MTIELLFKQIIDGTFWNKWNRATVIEILEFMYLNCVIHRSIDSGLRWKCYHLNEFFFWAILCVWGVHFVSVQTITVWIRNDIPFVAWDDRISRVMNEPSAQSRSFYPMEILIKWSLCVNTTYSERLPL